MRDKVPTFGKTPLIKISNAAVRAWVAELLAADLSAATARTAVFALRQCIDAAVADGRLMLNPTTKVPLPSERPRPPRFLSQDEVLSLSTRCRNAIEPLSWSAPSVGCVGAKQPV